MSTETLVLNKGYMEMNWISWQNAITLCAKGKAKIVECYKQAVYDVKNSKTLGHLFDWGENNQIWDGSKPKVIRLISFDPSDLKKSKRNVPPTKKNIYNRDKGKCVYCGCRLNLKNATIDHIVPKSRGGIHEWMNVALSCLECNNVKDNKTPEEANMKIKTKIYIPDLQNNWVTGVKVITNQDGTFSYNW